MQANIAPASASARDRTSAQDPLSRFRIHNIQAQSPPDDGAVGSLHSSGSFDIQGFLVRLPSTESE
jgi:hypothetical protein